jgi:hypothetical protein
MGLALLWIAARLKPDALDPSEPTGRDEVPSPSQTPSSTTAP